LRVDGGLARQRPTLCHLDRFGSEFGPAGDWLLDDTSPGDLPSYYSRNVENLLRTSQLRYPQSSGYKSSTCKTEIIWNELKMYLFTAKVTTRCKLSLI
jgi:hypothetical protein